MKSGIPDFDTAVPSGRKPTDSFRATVYENPNKEFSPAELLSEPWVKLGKLDFSPGVCNRKKYFNCYSSTNYILLGMLLAANSGARTWDEYDQLSAFPDVVRKELSHTRFAVTGNPAHFTELNGYDITSYNGNTKNTPKDVWNVTGVFSGWTASDITAPVGDIATLNYEIYGPLERVVSRATQEEMYLTSNLTGYGLATFNLTSHTGLSGVDGIAMGHLGATYGYQSIVAFFPGRNFSLSIGSNIERDFQE